MEQAGKLLVGFLLGDILAYSTRGVRRGVLLGSAAAGISLYALMRIYTGKSTKMIAWQAMTSTNQAEKDASQPFEKLKAKLTELIIAASNQNETRVVLDYDTVCEYINIAVCDQKSLEKLILEVIRQEGRELGYSVTIKDDNFEYVTISWSRSLLGHFITQIRNVIN